MSFEACIEALGQAEAFHFDSNQPISSMPTNKNFQKRITILDECFSRAQGTFTLDSLQDVLEERLGVRPSRKTVQNDIRYIQEIIKEENSQKGYSEEVAVFRPKLFDGKKKVFKYARPEFALGKQLLNKSDREQLSETLAILARYRYRADFRWLDELIPRIESAFQFVHEDYDSLISYQQNRDYSGQSWLGKLYNQLLRRKVLKVAYQAFGEKQPITRRIHPYHLKQYNERWFLFGFQQDEHYEGMTTLALDRIKGFSETTEDMIPDTTNWGDFFDDMIGVSKDPDAQPVWIKLKFSPHRIKYVVTKPLHGASQRLDLGDPEGRTVKIKVIPNRELFQQLLSFGSDVEVLEPDFVKAYLAEHAQKMLMYYVAQVRK
jgi:predicted DNA-binding transcriptional regulator YafY